MDAVDDLLRAYEDEVLVPLVRETGYDPIRDNRDFVMSPGSILFLMNNAADFAFRGDLVYWSPLSVLYADRNHNCGTVYTMEASFNPRREIVQFERTEITGVINIVRYHDHAAWKDPYSGNTFIRFPLEDSDKVLMNSWYLFRGAVFPMLEREVYRFVDESHKFAFQQTMIRHINELYKGTL